MAGTLGRVAATAAAAVVVGKKMETLYKKRRSSGHDFIYVTFRLLFFRYTIIIKVLDNHISQYLLLFFFRFFPF